MKVDVNSTACAQDLNSDKKIEVSDTVPQQEAVKISHPEINIVVCNNVPKSTHDPNLKRKIDDISCDGEPPPKQPKQNILNHSLPLLNLSNNHPLKKHSKLNHNGENVKNSSPKVVILDNDIIVPASDIKPPTILNKTMPIMQSTKPSTTISLSKSIMSTKASIMPQKLPSTTYGGQKAPCYMPKTTFSAVLNVPKPVTVNSR